MGPADPGERRRKLRAILRGARCVYPGSVFDAISARLAEDAGYEIGMLGGSIAAMAVLGSPDIAVITLTEFVEQTRRIVRAFTLPVIVDADHGYGDAHSVARSVVELEAAGIAALTIEDTRLPQDFGASAPGLVSRDEGLGKVKAALAARTDPDLVIVARTSALAFVGLDEAIARLSAYAQAGADALFVVGAKSPDEISAIRNATSLPIICPADIGLGDADAMARMGIRIALQGHQPFLAAIQAIADTMAALRAGTPPTALRGQPSPELIARATRAADYASFAKKFLAS